MAKYDHGGGFACGLQKVCDCREVPAGVSSQCTAFKDGFDAAVDGIKADQNPFSRNHIGYIEWKNGHVKALGKDAPRNWLIRKAGCFYRANRAGYTVEVIAAGLYTKAEAHAEARVEDTIQAVPLAQFADYVSTVEKLVAEKRAALT